MARPTEWSSLYTRGTGSGGRRSGRGGTERPPWWGYRVAPDSRGGTVRVPRTHGAIPLAAAFFFPAATRYGVHPVCPDASTAHAFASSAFFTATIGVYAMVSPATVMLPVCRTGPTVTRTPSPCAACVIRPQAA